MEWGGHLSQVSHTQCQGFLADFHWFCSISEQFCAALEAEQRFCSEIPTVLPAPFMSIPRDNGECAKTAPCSCLNLNYFWTLIQCFS